MQDRNGTVDKEELRNGLYGLGLQIEEKDVRVEISHLTMTVPDGCLYSHHSVSSLFFVTV